MPILHETDKCYVHIGCDEAPRSNTIPLAAHALLGCDSVAYMYGIGKAIVFKFCTMDMS